MPYILELADRAFLCRDELPSDLWHELDDLLLALPPKQRDNKFNRRRASRLGARVLREVVVDYDGLAAHRRGRRELDEQLATTCMA